MAVSLLQVGTNLSLEFEPSDIDAVRSIIRAHHPEVSVKEAGMASVVTFGGEDFTFQNEWDDPCLIANSARGNQLLEAIHAACCRN